MENNLFILVTLALILGSAAATRTRLLSVNDGNSTVTDSLSAGDGICSSLVEGQGYACEEHTVTTEDGYILSMQRIGQSGKKPDGPPVLLQHGILMDAVTWLLLPKGQSLASVLADNDFDVWLVSSRGTKYSLGHTSLDPNSGEYWDWTWDELAAYDLPATFNYVNGQTGQKLHYVGHSQGTLVALAAFSNSQLLNMLRSAALLCPIAYVNQITSPVARIASENFLSETLYWLNIHEFSPTGEAVSKLLELVCKAPGIDCTKMLTYITGENCCIDPSIIHTFLEHEPQSSATKNMIHLAQMFRTGTIAKYDYGDEESNKKHYGQAAPPVYNMGSIPNDVPLFLSYGGADALSDVPDVKHLLDDLKDHQGDKLVIQYRPDYAHGDYVMAGNAKQDVYDPLIAFFRLQ